MGKSKTEKVSPVSERFWEDHLWANKNFAEIVRQYPDQWVAIFNKKVVAAGKTITDVEEVAYKKTGVKEFPVLLAERGLHVYQD